MDEPEEHLLSVRDLHVTYAPRGAAVPAVRGVDVDLHPGETLGLAGESGCGKSSMAALRRLLPKGTKVTGEVLLDGEDVLKMKPGRLRAVRWTDLAIVFQGALHTLNPVQRVGDQIGEAIQLHSRDGRGKVARARPSCSSWWGYARARAPTHTSLRGPAPARPDRARARLRAAAARGRRADDSARRDGPGAGAASARGPPAGVRPGDHLHRTTSSTLAELSDRIAVMYAGRIVEQGPAEQVFTHAAHPYTRALSAAFPVIGDPAFRMNLSGVLGDPPDPRLPPSGCPFHPRCASAIDICSSTDVELWPAARVALPPACMRPGAPVATA